MLKQWEAEIKTRVRRGALDVYVFHGANREYKARNLAKYDVVITTYQTVVVEDKNQGVLYQVKWNRIILDEGHVIRNHKSKQSEAVCKLPGKRRWVLSGTPIQNKEFDLFAAVKFLRVKPFDELAYWKEYIDQKGESSSNRLQALLKAILLRRTKQQLMASGDVESLPEKSIEEFNVTLNREERLVYNTFLSYSQQIFANFLMQQQEKNNNFTYEKERVGKMYKKFARQHHVDEEIKGHVILTLLLRLRQICCHPGLAKEGLQATDDVNESGDANESVDDLGLLKQIEQMHIHDNNGDKQKISPDDDVFKYDVPSSKVEHMMEVLRKYVLNSDDKAIIVSQWTSVLNIIRGMLEIEGVKYCELNGTILVKNRNDIVVDFNKPKTGPKVMLLSLTAGGVGLNLVGANYLFLMDLHWNPQLEQQAQDRIYRFGQKKAVKIFK